jgi:hypothetical protein
MTRTPDAHWIEFDDGDVWPYPSLAAAMGSLEPSKTPGTPRVVRILRIEIDPDTGLATGHDVTDAVREAWIDAETERLSHDWYDDYCEEHGNRAASYDTAIDYEGGFERCRDEAEEKAPFVVPSRRPAQLMAAE